MIRDEKSAGSAERKPETRGTRWQQFQAEVRVLDSNQMQTVLGFWQGVGEIGSYS